MKEKRAEAGYSLLEVVMAFAIASLALALLYDTTGSALERERAATMRLGQLGAAENLMERVGAGIPLEVNSEEGITEAGINWTVSIEEAPKNSGSGSGETVNTGVRLFKVEVATWDRNEAHATRLVTYRIRTEE